MSDKGPTCWGFMGCGEIAKVFANAMTILPKEEHQIIAVAARDLERAEEFAKKFGIRHAFAGYEKLASCPEVDVVYVNVLHPYHLKCVMLALNAGKAVLVEKPMAMNSKQVRKMVQLARQKGLFLMEGFWSRFFPVYEEIRRAIMDGSIGEAKFLQGNFGLQITVPRILRKDLGGGSLLDFGCYLINLVTMIFDGERPKRVHAIGKLNDDGIDIMDCITLVYKNGATVQLMISAEVVMTQQISLYGTKGQLQIPGNFIAPTEMVLNSKVIHHPLPDAKNKTFLHNSQGFTYEMKEIRECLMQGKSECSIMPLDHSIVVMEIMDEIRRQVGVVYPEDSVSLAIADGFYSQQGGLVSPIDGQSKAFDVNAVLASS